MTAPIRSNDINQEQPPGHTMKAETDPQAAIEAWFSEWQTTTRHRFNTPDFKAAFLAGYSARAAKDAERIEALEAERARLIAVLSRVDISDHDMVAVMRQMLGMNAITKQVP